MKNIKVLFVLVCILFIPFIVNAEECNLNDIEIYDIKIQNQSENVIEKSNPVIMNRKISLDLKMDEIGDSIEYKFSIKNNSEDDFNLDVDSVNSDYFEYHFRTEDGSNVIKSNEEKIVILKINYKTEIPDNLLENRVYHENKDVLMLMNNQITSALNNPKTGNLLTIVFILLLIISIGLFKFRKYHKIFFIILGLSIIPISTLALCQYKMQIDMDVEIGEEIAPNFANDSWETIITNVRNNPSVYEVGDTKLIDMGEFGTHTIRVSNNTTPVECSNEGFSQTACGFVLEFVDIITTHNMNSSGTNAGSWPASAMRTYVNNDIYNALPNELKNKIVSTTVISGHSWIDSSDFTSTDKIYLLSFYEIFGTADVNNSLHYSGTAYNSTRQLDFYANINSLYSNLSETYKLYDNSVYGWWLRSPYSHNSGSFFGIYDCGYVDDGNASEVCGVSPAFRIG